ncbi:putative reverse transcriptase (RNA-dependent DNA polymerase), partial [Trifolium pratense]
MHVKFDDKEPDRMSELVEGVSNMQISEDESLEHPSFSERLEFSESLEVQAPTEPEIQNNVTVPEPETLILSDEEDEVPRSSFKYKSSHPEELIIGNKDSPRKTRSSFRNEES